MSRGSANRKLSGFDGGISPVKSAYRNEGISADGLGAPVATWTRCCGTGAREGVVRFSHPYPLS